MENPEMIQDMAYIIVKLLLGGAVFYSSRITFVQLRALIIEIVAPLLRIVFNEKALLTLAIKRLGINLDTDKLDKAAEIVADALERYANEAVPLAERDDA